MKTSIVKVFTILTIILLNFGCDQITKSIVRDKVLSHQRIEVLGDYLVLTNVENKGAFLSLGNDLPFLLREILLTYFPIIVLIVAIIYIFLKTDLPKITVISISFVIGGGIGNIYDRFLHGSVTDFLHMDLILFRTGIFNMADLSIMIGTIMMLLHYVFHQLNWKKEDAPELEE